MSQKAQLNIVFETEQQQDEFIGRYLQHIQKQIDKMPYGIILVTDGFEAVFELFCFCKELERRGEITCLDMCIATLNHEQFQQNVARFFEKKQPEQLREVRELAGRTGDRELFTRKLRHNRYFEGFFTKLSQSVK